MQERRNLVKSITHRRSLGELFIERQSLLLLVILGIVTLSFGFTTPRFFTSSIFSVIAFQCAEIGLMGLGMGITMMINGIDLSVNDTANLSALMAGLFLLTVFSTHPSARLIPLFIVVAVLIALITGLLCGVLNGFLIAHLHVPPILATLGTLTLYRGISVAITGGKSLTGFPDQLSVIGRTTLLGIPTPFLILLVMGVTMHVLLNYTTFGFKIQMVGTNVNAAKFSGIKNKSITMWVYILSSIFSSIAGIIIMSRTGSVAYEYGTQTYILLALLIASLAGISPGFGSIAALILATFILQMISTGFYMLLMTVPGGGFFKNFFWGAFLILVLIAVQIIRRKRGTE